MPENNTIMYMLVGMAFMGVLLGSVYYSGNTIIQGVDGITLADNAFKIIDISGGSNATADNAEDTVTFVAGTGMIISANYTTDVITFNSTGGGGENTSASNLGGGENIFAQEVLDDLEFKTLVDDGTGVSLSSDSNEVTLSLDNIVHDSITNCVTDGHILKYRTATEWGCEADIGGGSGDNLGDHTATTTIQVGSQLLNFTEPGQTISANSDGFDFDTPSGDAHDLRINSNTEFRFEETLANFFSNRLTSLGAATSASDATRADQLGLLGSLVTVDCSDGQLLEYQLSNSTWICANDDTGGGSNALLDGTVHTDTVAQTVTRGSIIYGDSTPNWNELTVGASDTVLKSDGTDISYGKLVNADVDNAAAIGWSKISKTGSSIHDIANVTSTGCAQNEILKVNGSALWDCAADNTGGSSDIISENDSNVEVIDIGTGEINIDLDGALEYFVNATHFDFNTNQFAGSMGCTDDQIITYDSVNDEWICYNRIAEPNIAILTAGGATLQASATPARTTIDGSNMDYIVLDFDTSSSETVIWNWEVPDNMDAAEDITARVRFQVATGSAGVCWDGSWLGRTAGETVDSSFGTVVGACDSSTGTNAVETATLTFTTAQHGLAAGDSAFFKLSRDVADGTDTNANDARLIDIRVTWQ